jgi:hypothetical protein
MSDLARLAALPLILMLVASGQASALDELGWLVGAWERPSGDYTAVEEWARTSPNTLEGIVYLTDGNQKRVTEHLRIERFADRIYYLALPVENEFPTPFELVENDGGRWVFENPGYDFPQRLIYSSAGPPANSLRSIGRTRAGRVLQYANLLHRDQALVDHLVENPSEFLGVLLGVDDLDDDGKIFRQPQNVRGVQDASGSKTGNSPKHRGPGEAFLPKALEQGHVQRLAVPAIGLADVDAGEDLFSVQDTH